VHLHPQGPRGLSENLPKAGRNWIGKADVRRDSLTKKSVIAALAGAIEKLRRQEHVTRRVFFLKAADGGDADDPAHIQRAERIDVRAMIQFVRKQTVAATVSRKEIDLPALYLPADDRVGWITKRRFNPLLRRVLYTLHLVKPASADNANGRPVFSHCGRLNLKLS
jgi:hypothetical protein